MSRKGYQTPPPDFLTTKKTNYNNHYIRLYDEMIDSPAYIALSDQAKAVYTLLVREYKGIFTGNVVKCPYALMESHGIRRQSIANWLAELQALGFIQIEIHGGMFRNPNEYRLINGWADFKDIDSAKAAKNAARQERKEKRTAAKATKQKALKDITK